MDYTELRTSEVSQVEQFVRQQAERLESSQITLRKSGGFFIATLSQTDEPTT